MESGILLRFGIQNYPSSTDKDWIQVPGIRNPLRGIQNPTDLDSLTWGEFEFASTTMQLPIDR